MTPEILTEVTKLFQDDFPDDDAFRIESNDFLSFIQNKEVFKDISTLEDFCKYLINTKLNLTFPLMFKLIVILLTLPITTSTAERSFSALKLIKSRLRSTMVDNWTANQLIIYINRDISKATSPEEIYDFFIKSGSHRSVC